MLPEWSGDLECGHSSSKAGDNQSYSIMRYTQLHKHTVRRLKLSGVSLSYSFPKKKHGTMTGLSQKKLYRVYEKKIRALRRVTERVRVDAA